MDERKVGLIPYLVVPGAMGMKEYGVLLTDRQTIFVLEKKSSAGMGYAIGGVIGAAIANAASTRRAVDYENTPPEMLASDPKNIAVPHEAVNTLRLKRSFGGSYGLQLEYTDPAGKRRKVQALVSPPPELVKQQRAAGVKAKDATAAYAGKVREAFLAALPPTVAARTEWLL